MECVLAIWRQCRACRRWGSQARRLLLGLHDKVGIAGVIR
jgi:hypothetical protein